MTRWTNHNMEIAKGTGEEPPLRPYEAYYSDVLDSVRVKMPDGDIFQWPMIKRSPNLPHMTDIHATMQMAAWNGGRSKEYQAIYRTIRDETHRQLGDAIYHVQWKLVHQRVKNYVTAKARAKYPILMRFTDDWAALGLMRRCMRWARQNFKKGNKPNPVRKRKRESEAK